MKNIIITVPCVLENTTIIEDTQSGYRLHESISQTEQFLQASTSVIQTPIHTVHL